MRCCCCRSLALHIRHIWPIWPASNGGTAESRQLAGKRSASQKDMTAATAVAATEAPMRILEDISTEGTSSGVSLAACLP
jgi:hypothetical protein